jgi:hypothetical protein
MLCAMHTACAMCAVRPKLGRGILLCKLLVLWAASSHFATKRLRINYLRSLIWLIPHQTFPTGFEGISAQGVAIAEIAHAIKRSTSNITDRNKNSIKEIKHCLTEI